MAKCNCSGNVTIVTTLPCPQACSQCFIPKNYIVPVADRVAPCGGEGTLDVDGLNDFSTTCSGNLTYSIFSYDTDGFNSVSITSGGLLSYELSDLANVGSYYSITYRVRCDAEGVGGYGVIQVSPLDLCLTANCTPSQTCNKCTGECDDIAVDLSINMQ